MSLGGNIQRWRKKQRRSTAEVEQRAGLAPDALDAIEADETDPPASMLAAIAGAIGIPTPWLHASPDQIDALFDSDADDSPDPARSVDPVTEQILKAQSNKRELFALLATLIVHGDSKQLRAAELNLRSLIKETRRSPIPWENRQPGNFEPPND
jgi:transcriptional regulator with XRE-family HTH domain